MASEAVLLVDDDEHLRGVIADALRRAGYSVVTATTGEAALALLMQPETHVAAVVLDVQLPGLDGDDVVRELRRHERWSRLPVVASTALSDPDDVRALLAAGFTAHIAKPYSMDDLVSTLERVIAEASE